MRAAVASCHVTVGNWVHLGPLREGLRGMLRGAPHHARPFHYANQDNDPEKSVFRYFSTPMASLQVLVEVGHSYIACVLCMSVSVPYISPPTSASSRSSPLPPVHSPELEACKERNMKTLL